MGVRQHIRKQEPALDKFHSAGLLILFVMILAMAILAGQPTYASGSLEFHVVQRGETLGQIAQRYGVTQQQLVELNGLANPNRIGEGQRLIIGDGPGRFHVVARGETLSGIASRYGVPLQDLVALNGIVNPNRLSVGDVLVVSAGVRVFHTVEGGDTLWDISRAYGVSLEALQAANDIRNASRLRVGQELTIPTGTATGGGSDVAAAALARAYANAQAQRQRVTMVWPLRGRISSPFGPRWGRMHVGLDIAAPVGTPIRAAAAGTVVYADWAGSYGRMVTIDHGNDIKTRYAHNSRVLVSVGQSVSQGQEIARVGSTGDSTGPHLHFEVLVDGEHQDPEKWLP